MYGIGDVRVRVMVGVKDVREVVLVQGRTSASHQQPVPRRTAQEFTADYCAGSICLMSYIRVNGNGNTNDSHSAMFFL